MYVCTYVYMYVCPTSALFALHLLSCVLSYKEVNLVLLLTGHLYRNLIPKIHMPSFSSREINV